MKQNLIGLRFGALTVTALSARRGSRGARTVPLWECICDCGNITYKATDALKNSSKSMCSDCAEKYAASKMRERAGYVGGTQISRIKSDKLSSANTSGARGVYLDKHSKKWRARIKFKGKTVSLGYFSSLEDAVKARMSAEDEIYGKFLAEQEDDSIL